MQRTDLFRSAAEMADDDRFDPRDIEKPTEKCRACGALWCNGSCPEMPAWLEAQYAAQDAAWLALDLADHAAEGETGEAA